MAWTERLPSGNYRAGYRIPSGEKRYLEGTYTQQRAAHRAATAAEVESHQLGWRDPRAAERLWSEWVTEWFPQRRVDESTQSRDRSRLKKLLIEWGDTPIHEITRLKIKSWAARLVADGRAHSTVLKDVALLSASLTAAADAEIIPANPALRLKLGLTPATNERTLSIDEQHRLFAAFHPGHDELTPHEEAIVLRDQALTGVLLGTGARWGEAVALAAAHFEHGGIRYRRSWDARNRELKNYTKGKQPRTVPLPAWLDELTLPLREAIPRGYLFADATGEPLDYANWRKRNWLPAIERSGLNSGEHDHNVTPHTLRHTYATEQLEHGRTIGEIADLLGHASMAMAEKYAHRRTGANPAAAQAIRDPRSAPPAAKLPDNVTPLFRAR